MQIVLKTGGVTLIGLSLIGLIYGAVSQWNARTPSPTDVANVTSNLLLNGDFEGEREATKPESPDATGRIGGINGVYWQDNSAWAPIGVNYAVDTDNPHGGKSCQKITVTNKQSGQAQFIHRLKSHPRKTLQATVWMRAKSPTHVAIELRNPTNVYAPYGREAATVGTQWQKVEVTGKLVQTDNTALMIVVEDPGTVWVDDAVVTEQP